MFLIEFHKKADDFINSLPALDKERILKRLKRLEETPVPSDSKYIKKGAEGFNIFRYRIGSYRFLYIVDYQQSLVIIVKGDKRDSIYTDLNSL